MATRPNTISVIKRKVNGENFLPLYISPEQCFVRPMRNSYNNNLEEELILGTDRITTSWIDNDGNQRIQVEYRHDKGIINSGYYMLDTTIYANGYNTTTSYSVEGSELVVQDPFTFVNDNDMFFNNIVSTVDGGTLNIDTSNSYDGNNVYIKDHALCFNADATEVYIDNETHTLVANGEYLSYNQNNHSLDYEATVIIRYDALYYVKDDKTSKTKISEKITYQDYKDNKNIVREVINNFLKTSTQYVLYNVDTGIEYDYDKEEWRISARMAFENWTSLKPKQIFAGQLGYEGITGNQLKSARVLDVANQLDGGGQGDYVHDFATIIWGSEFNNGIEGDPTIYFTITEDYRAKASLEMPVIE